MIEIPIVFSSNEAFVPYMSAMLESIMEHSDAEKKYAIFVLHSELKDSTKEKLEQQTSKLHFKTSFLNVNQHFDKLNFHETSFYTREVYFRLVIPWIFSQYEKVIYLDGDMITNVDVAELLDMDMGDNCLMASRISGCLLKNSLKNNKLGLQNPENHFCSGLLVFNTKKFRELISMQDLLKFAGSRKWNTVDQDVLNILCEGKTLLLDSSWNFLAGHYSKERLDSLPEKYRSDFEDAKQNPKIIHFTCGEFYRGKPDKSPFYILYAEYFWKYAAKSPFIEDILSNMYEKGLVQNSVFAQSAFLAGQLGIKARLKLAIYILWSALKAALQKCSKALPWK